MRYWLMASALLAASAWAQDDVVEDSIEPASISRGAPDAPALGVRLREGGLLQVQVGEDWKETTLDGLKERLASFAEEQDRGAAKLGKSAYEILPGGVKVSRLFVSIDIEPSVPWQHVEWIMTAVAEQHYRKLEFSDGTRKMLVTLPTDGGIHATPQEPPLEIKIPVHAVARSEKQGTWGDATVLRPSEVRYRLGSSDKEGTTTDVADYVKKAQQAVKDTPNAQVFGQIKAGHKVPFANVFDLMDVFEKAGLKRLSIYGTQIPPRTVRTASRLPYPVKNYGVGN